ncbi:MAG TPA: biotin/lipoyl-containing protein [Anaerolineales bacterium]|jgi:biotin carboxyl carrier protein|nr:biotin/lipoyl-containing protein [Anaerolineales bacterium]
MKYNVTIQDKSYVVEIEDINARPVIVFVEGIRFEVIPDTNPLGVEGNQRAVQKETREVHSIDLRQTSSAQNANEMTAPLPGTVVEVFVKAGDDIEAGQVIVIIEAMKMKNSIRSTRGGKIAEVLVSAMQTVAHKQALVRFE